MNAATRISAAYRLTFGAWLALQCLFVFKTLLLPMGGRDPNITMWAVHSLPLLIFLPGLWRGDVRSFAWLAFAILMYFLVTVDALFSTAASRYHWLALALIVALFTGCTVYIRWQGQYQQAQRGET